MLTHQPDRSWQWSCMALASFLSCKGTVFLCRLRCLLHGRWLFVHHHAGTHASRDRWAILQRKCGRNGQGYVGPKRLACHWSGNHQDRCSRHRRHWTGQSLSHCLQSIAWRFGSRTMFRMQCSWQACRWFAMAVWSVCRSAVGTATDTNVMHLLARLGTSSVSHVYDMRPSSIERETVQTQRIGGKTRKCALSIQHGGEHWMLHRPHIDASNGRDDDREPVEQFHFHNGTCTYQNYIGNQSNCQHKYRTQVKHSDRTGLRITNAQERMMWMVSNVANMRMRGSGAAYRGRRKSAGRTASDRSLRRAEASGSDTFQGQ